MGHRDAHRSWSWSLQGLLRQPLWSSAAGWGGNPTPNLAGGSRTGVDTNFTKDSMGLVRSSCSWFCPTPNRHMDTWASLRWERFCSSKIVVTKKNSLEKIGQLPGNQRAPP